MNRANFRFAIVVLLTVWNQSFAANYTVTLLPLATGIEGASGYATNGDSKVGTVWGAATGYSGHAALWNGASNEFVDLHPAGFESTQATDVYGTSQVGVGYYGGDLQHALLWHGSANSVVDLHPAGATRSSAWGVDGEYQVGTADNHAMLWHGTAESAVSLMPSGFTSTGAYGISGNRQIGEGWGTATGGTSHALVWNGTAESFVDLHPAGYESSGGRGVFGQMQVGFANTSGGPPHAMIWNGSSASAVDLHPAGFTSSIALGVNSHTQVGSADTGTPNQFHAFLWRGTAASAVDLHLVLTHHDPAFVTSSASSISETGIVTGAASRLVDGITTAYAVIWTPIPDPVSGDYNENGIVDAADFTLWRDRLGQIASLPNDNTPGVGPDDYARWESHFGESAGIGAVAAIPEPAAGVMVLSGIVVILADFRWRREGLVRL